MWSIQVDSQQDGAPSHTAKTTMNFLKRENVSFIEPQMWPPNSPDLNPVDYAVCGALQQQVYHNRKFTTVDHRHLYAVDQLKQAIVQEWTTCRSASLTAALTSGVVVLLVLYSSTVDILSTLSE